MSSGSAIRSTSSGIRTISCPLRLNITTMVKSRATSVIGEMRGMNSPSYHCLPLARSSTKRVRIPARKGTPR